MTVIYAHLLDHEDHDMMHPIRVSGVFAR